MEWTAEEKIKRKEFALFEEVVRGKKNWKSGQKDFRNQC
jgi:hypothetical protein